MKTRVSHAVVPSLNDSQERQLQNRATNALPLAKP